AAEPATTVLAIGGKPGEAYTPSAWEHYFAAGAASAAGDHAEAVRLIEAGVAAHPDNPAVLVNAARYSSLARHPGAAVAYLKRAYAANPKPVGDGQADSALDAIRARADWPIPVGS